MGFLNLRRGMKVRVCVGLGTGLDSELCGWCFGFQRSAPELGCGFFFFSSLSIVDVGNADAGTGEVGQEPFCINN